MTVRRRILVFEIAGVVFVAAMIAIMVMALQFADRFAQRLDAVQRRFEIIAELNANTHDYARQVAAAMVVGDRGADGLQGSRITMERNFALLTQATRAQISALGDMVAVQNELPELENTRRMIELYHAIDMSATRALALQRDGQKAQATQVFDREVDFRLSNELETLLASGMQDERDEINSAAAELRAGRQTVFTAAGIVGVLAIVCLGVLGLMLRRSIVKPVQALTSGAEAIAAGNLDERIKVAGKGEFAGLARVLNDMAEAIKVQRAGLLESGERLSSDVDARTRQLREVNERLRDVDGRRAQFLADVSHELRTPLTILRGEADVALRGPGDAIEQRQSLERIQGQAVELSQLLDDLIAFARTDAETYQHIPAETPLDEVVEAAVQEGRVLAEPREIGVLTALGDKGARINADFRRLKQALIIGLDNAVKHSPPGGKIVVATALDERGVKVRIMDEGPGIAAEDKPQVFERFFRGRGEGDLFNQGLGIGLSIAREIVERHDGTVTLDNRPEGGAVLEITLPLAGGSLV
ncbi:MAG TPA: HAMP domain-containing sensor histidine kinase [Devosiaceae bacterium]|jgi:signal transduction histidine kinase